MSEIKIINAKKIYHDVPVIENLNITIPKGSLFTLLGPSGCGKRTSSYDCRFQQYRKAENFTSMIQKINNMGTQQTQYRDGFPKLRYFPHLTVRDNVAFGLKQKKVQKKN